MSAKSDLKNSIIAMNEKLLEFDDQEEASDYYAEELSNIIDSHAKSLIAKIGATQITELVLVAGPYPVTSTNPLGVELKIDDSLSNI